MADYLHVGGFCVRVAALPINNLRAISESQQPQSEDAGGRLAALFTEPYLLEALQVASPALAKRFSALLAIAPMPLDSKWQATLANYLARACLRATPFGLFAGVGAGRIDATTSLRVHPNRAWIRHTRLDHAVLVEEAAAALDVHRADPSTTYAVNSTLYRVGEYSRYFTATGTGSEHMFRHTQAKLTPPIAFAIDRCRVPCMRADLVAALAQAFDARAADVETFVDGLVGRGILHCALMPALTSDDALTDFLDRSPDVVSLRESAQAIERSDGTRCDDHTGNVFFRGGSEMSRYQVDTEIAADILTLGTADVDAIAEAVGVLGQLSDDERADPFMDGLAQRFVERWNHALVPLAVVADDDCGLALAGSAAARPHFLRGMDLRATSERRSSPPLGARERWLVGRAAAALQDQEREIVISASDLGTLPPPDPDARPLPSAISVVASVYTGGNDTESTLWIENIAHSATAMLGRFCSVSPGIDALVRQIVVAEAAQHPDAVMAEIVHLPRPRSGNIASRPVLRAYEIPYAGISGAPQERQLRLDDLFVGVDQKNCFFLWSQQLHRRVVPLLSCAHNTGLQNGLSVYRFLCGIADQGRRRFQALLSDPTLQPHVPSIRYGRCVLRAATWHISRQEFEGLRADPRRVAAWAARRNVPCLTTYGVGDRTRVLDLESMMLIREFVGSKHRFPLVLREAWPSQHSSALRDTEGRPHRHEIVVPMLLRTQPAAAPHVHNRPRAEVTAHVPGGRWLSVKIYAGQHAADHLLSHVLGAVVDEHGRRFPGEPWFFVRYADPQWHLRLRFAGDNVASVLLPMLHDSLTPLVGSNLVARVLLDTYVPELDRYGGTAAISLVEQLFCADSNLYRALLDIDPDEDKRVQIGVHATRALLDDFGFDNAAALDLVTRSERTLLTEFGASSLLKKQVGEAYRRDRAVFEDEPSELLRAVLTRRRIASSSAMQELQRLEREAALQSPLAVIAGSVLHMSMNRLFRSDARAQEMLVYAFYRRALLAQRARTSPP